MKPQGWKAEREFNSREYAAAFYACMGWMAECSRRQKTGQAMTTIEDVCRQAVERASHARLADISQAGDELDRDELQELSDSESLQPRRETARRLPRDMARSLCPLRHAQEVEHEIDLLISDADGSEGEGE